MRKRLKALACILVVALIIGVLWELFLSQLFGGMNFGLMPSIDYMSNPMGNLPDINPVSNANPFSGIYKNPFG